MTAELVTALADAGGSQAPASASAQLHELLVAELRSGRAELAKSRSGYEHPLVVGLAAHGGAVLAALPLPAALRADPDAVSERGWLLAAATVGALAELADLGPPMGAAGLALGAGAIERDALVLRLPGGDALEPGELDVLGPLAFEEHAAGIDRLRAQAVALPAAILADVATDLREPIGAAHPLRIAEAVARLGGHPSDAASIEQHEDQVLALIGDTGGPTRPHADPDPTRRVARRILQRLDGMGKWGGYHTEFSHLARGFGGNERALAQAVGEALLSAGLLAEKPSVGQRHVFLNPRRAADIHRMIEDGEVPADLALPAR